MSETPHRLCPKCGYNSPRTTECAHCGIVFEKYRDPLFIPKANSISAEEDTTDSLGVEATKNFKLNLWALPAVAVFTWIADMIWPIKAVGFFTSVIPLHEMGHAVTAWMGGRYAFPAGAIVPSAGMTLIGFERQKAITAFLLCLGIVLSYFAANKRLWFLSGLGLLFLGGTVYLSLGITNIELSILISYGGIAGEFVLGTVLILAFYNPLFEKLRWDFFRFPFFLMGGYCFFNAMLMWLHIQARSESLPFGSAVSSDGAADASGDMNRLVAGGWTEDQIISRYLMLGKICLILILLQYAYSLWQSRQSLGTKS